MTEIVHACPPGSSGVTPCCGRTPFELDPRSRMTIRAELVTCGRQPQTVTPEGHVDDVGCWCGPLVDPIAGLMHALIADPVIDVAHLEQQRQWSRATFGPGSRTAGVVDHIRKELREIEAAPDDLGEWVDVILLAFDGAWRSGAEPAEIIAAVRARQARNEARVWPDWRAADPDRAIEHVRGAAGAAGTAGDGYRAGCAS